MIYFCVIQQIIHLIFSEANWGSSTQAQQFVLALKNVQSLNDVPDHVKNYRPKLLVFTGLPIHRQPLVDFGYLITKKLSLMICSHIEPVNMNYSKGTMILEYFQISVITKHFMANNMRVIQKCFLETNIKIEPWYHSKKCECLAQGS